MAIKELDQLTQMLKRLVLARWTDSDILDHVTIRLPAPIFHHLGSEIQAETQLTAPTAGGRPYDHFTFNGIKFERVDGSYWPVPRS